MRDVNKQKDPEVLSETVGGHQTQQPRNSPPEDFTLESNDATIDVDNHPDEQYQVDGLKNLDIRIVPRSSKDIQQPAQQTFNLPEQTVPPSMKQRLTAYSWEDEGTIVFQVQTRGVAVARREDNNFINGTKLLNVAGMSRGRRDGILKAERTRHVVKIGPMNLKGVWVPFERALKLANEERITDLLHPLFHHNLRGPSYPVNDAISGFEHEPSRMMDLYQESSEEPLAQTWTLKRDHTTYLDDVDLVSKSSPGGRFNHALYDYHSQLRLLEQHRKKRIMRGQQEFH